MTLLEIKTVKAPTLYKEDNKSAKEFKEVLESLLEERDKLMQEKKDAITRLKEIPNEINKLKQSLVSSFDSEERELLKESIQSLEDELLEKEEASQVDVKEIMMDKTIESGVFDLKDKAHEEYVRWFEEINPYEKALDEAYRKSRNELRNFRDYNIYKRSASQLDSLKTYLLKR